MPEPAELKRELDELRGRHMIGPTSSVSPGFGRHDLLVGGFEGFVTFVTFATLDLKMVPNRGGVYVLLREAQQPPAFLERSPAGRFKGRDPSVSPVLLGDRWVDRAEILYMGKASASLRGRLSAYRRHGQGAPVGHWGGRLVWQLADSDKHLVAWKEAAEARELERRMIADFAAEYGRRPFGNLRA